MIRFLRNTPVWASLMACLVTASPIGVVGAETLPDISVTPRWTLAERIDGPGGYVLSRRDLADSDFPVFRLEATIDAPISTVAAAVRKNVIDPTVSPKHTKKTVLRDDEDVIVIYSYIELPLVADRDVTTRTEVSFDPETGSYRFTWRATDDGPAPKEGVVRLQNSSGSWVFTPLAEGGTSAVNESHTEIEGSIPAWLVTSIISDAVIDGLVKLRARVELDLKQMASESGERPSRVR